MGILVALSHVTHYRYDRAISMGMQTIRLRPAPHTRSHIQSYALKVTPAEHFINWQQDPFGNYQARVVFQKPIKEFRIDVDLITEIRVFNPFDFFLEDYARDFPFAYEPLLKEELAPYLEIKEKGPLLQKILADFLPLPLRGRVGVGGSHKEEPLPLKGRGDSSIDMIDFLVALNQQLNHSLHYGVRLEPGIQACEETLSLKSGSCRDMAWLLCQILRHLGFATRFTSGYLIQLKADVKPLEGPAGVTEDFTDLHAWTEVYLPGAGWVGLDPTSGLFAGEGHIPLSCTPNPSSAAPISGTLERCESTLEHTMKVMRIHEDVRVTKPYTPEQWQAIDKLGDKVDGDLKKRDVRLTMGGEPTFVSAHNRTSNEWHFGALGDDKYRLGNAMLARLRAQFAPGSLIHRGQGKWYPGEILPRWAMSCYWRKDGDALWQDDSLLADPAKNHNHTLKAARQFLVKLGETFGIAASHVLPAREDTPYYLWKEQRLPMESDMLKANVYEKTERQRLQKLIDQHLNEPVGYVLPLHYSPRRQRWISNAWKFRSGHLILLPGDSPVGLRLPLAALPVVLPDDQYHERSPFDETGPLPSRKSIAKALGKKSLTSSAKDKSGLVRTAICAEIRGGTLHLFLPPVTYAEHFCELIAAIEHVAASLKTPVVLEGYNPPGDRRFGTFSVTPDPGVLEINVQPAASWQELKTITSTVYGEAYKAGLTTEKFMLDGRRVGTGGGNHIVMGAATPADSPFLRRPDILQSLITFWQHHPSLSYLFSGLYIGPTSQAPRIDEARNDSLYELEIAFSQIPKKGEVPPWLADRLLRNILIDLTGNTHRAEFCIDKLYSPDSDRGRLGLLEMRGFEMPPHPQMSLLQALLLRACISHFWKTPYHHPLIRWGTSLHDKFMLPYYAQQDFTEVLHTLKTGGYAFAPEWFEPFFIFRFPHYGSVSIGNSTLELRMALEPWPVMGEEMGAGGVSRSVDSSVERLQICVRGLEGNRHILACNGRRVPLQATAEKGVYVAGIRFKAWSPASALQPLIPVQTPLTFDLLDCHHQRSLGGCRYHAMHPGGRSYDTLPVNDNAAEGRRLAAFEAMGHTPGHIIIPLSGHHPDFPCTLDLRMPASAP